MAPNSSIIMFSCRYCMKYFLMRRQCQISHNDWSNRWIQWPINAISISSHNIVIPDASVITPLIAMASSPVTGPYLNTGPGLAVTLPGTSTSWHDAPSHRYVLWAMFTRVIHHLVNSSFVICRQNHLVSLTLSWIDSSILITWNLTHLHAPFAWEAKETLFR